MCSWCCKKFKCWNIQSNVTRHIKWYNDTRHLKWHETSKCECRLDASVSNKKQPWNDDKCRSECKELIGKDVCDKGYTWNCSNWECECD